MLTGVPITRFPNSRRADRHRAPTLHSRLRHFKGCSYAETWEQNKNMLHVSQTHPDIRYIDIKSGSF